MLLTQNSLIERCKDTTDTVSWQELHDCYEPFLRRFTALLGVPPSDIDDAVQEIFMRLSKALDQSAYDRRRGRFRTWLRRVARNVVFDLRRKRKDILLQVNPSDLIQDIRSHAGEKEFQTAHRKRVLEYALKHVQDESHRVTWSCFEQHVLQKKPAVEVAQQLQLTVNNVYVNSSRILARVRKKCAQFDEELSDAAHS